MRGGSVVSSAAVLALASTISTGCRETPGELDPQVVHDLSRQPGDSEDLDLTGTYSGQITIAECGCPEIEALKERSLCNGIDGVNPEVGQSGFVSFEVVQTDGILMLRLDPLSLTGPIYEDGNFSVGGLFDMTTALSTGNIVSRMDGTFDLDSNRRDIEALAQVRFNGDAAFDIESTDDRTSLDCVERYEIVGSR